jgi:hypothetical protein
MEYIKINDDDIKLLMQVLSFTNNKEVIKHGNYFNKSTGEFGNTFADFQNWCYEKLGRCLIDDKRQLTGLLDEKNREDYNNRLKEFEAKND